MRNGEEVITSEEIRKQESKKIFKEKNQGKVVNGRRQSERGRGMEDEWIIFKDSILGYAKEVC